jgi:hypothetical protein
MAVPYVKQTWTDGSGGATPLSAARLGNLEQGVYDAHRMPCACVYHSTTQSITSGPLTVVAFDSERFDTDTIHDTVTNTSRLTCKTAGVYQITAQVDWAVNATGYRQTAIRLNGTVYIAQNMTPAAATANTNHTPTRFWSMAVNDYVEVVVSQDSGVSLLVGGSLPVEFMMVRVST